MSFVTGLRCVHCDARYPVAAMFEGCPACAAADFASGLTPDYDYAAYLASIGDGPLAREGVGVWRFRDLLPVDDPACQLTLGEGGTPLIPLPRLAVELGVREIWLKDESRNPTWSFKDRNAAVTVSKALEFGAKTVVVSTSGNHGAAVAAYAARGGMRCVALTYHGIPAGTRVLMQAFGAELIVTTPEGRWTMMREAVRERGWYPAANFTDLPTNGAYGHEGYKTIAYELFDQLGRVPDIVAIPTAYGEGLFGIWKGFDELIRLGRTATAPRMIACEPQGGPLSVAYAGGSNGIARVPRTPTVARGIGGTANSYIAIAALKASDGLAIEADDEAIMAAQRDLATEGFFVEPASAAGLACLRVAARRGELAADRSIVLVNTSSGLKNLDAIASVYPEPASIAPPLPALEPTA